MKRFFKGCVEVHFKLVTQNEAILKKSAPTPYLAHDDKDYYEESDPKGQLQPAAAKVIKNLLYGARMPGTTDCTHAKCRPA